MRLQTRGGGRLAFQRQAHAAGQSDDRGGHLLAGPAALPAVRLALHVAQHPFHLGLPEHEQHAVKGVCEVVRNAADGAADSGEDRCADIAGRHGVARLLVGPQPAALMPMASLTLNLSQVASMARASPRLPAMAFSHRMAVGAYRLAARIVSGAWVACGVAMLSTSGRCSRSIVSKSV